MSLRDTFDAYTSSGPYGGRRFVKGLEIPTIAVERQFRFVVNTRESSFEPPHVHVWVGSEDVCRIELIGGTFMDAPPPGTFRDIMKTYARYAEDIIRAWDAIHGG